MNTNELIKKYIEFFKLKKHKEISGAGLIPENDPSALFISAGMHPLVHFLLGQEHPAGKRLVGVQNCIRTGDIDAVGDEHHITFFQMLGNWSLGDYWKKESIEWSLEFLTRVLGFNPEKLHITCFKGDKETAKDEETAKIWIKLGIPKERIYFFGREDNWWGPAGKTGPCGPDTEIFADTGREKCSFKCMPGCKCGKYFEIWNNVFMQYNKNADCSYSPLKQKNIDTGMGVERTVAVLNGFESVYDVNTIKPIYDFVFELAVQKDARSIRIITDHLIAGCMILNEEITPSNLDKGYVLRRLVRRAIRHARMLGIDRAFCCAVAEEIIKLHNLKNKHFILEQLRIEEEKFSKTLAKGLREFEKMKADKIISGKEAFVLFSSYGFPLEIIKELANERGIRVDEKRFALEFSRHQELSRKGAEKRFSGGLADAGSETVKLHTATHLLYKALQEVLGDKVKQRGSNITTERLRFDFSFDRKMTDEEISRVERIVNLRIKENLPVAREEMTLDEAKKKGIKGLFEHKYKEKVFVYSIGNYSKEICMGPHADNTKELGKFKIIKEESSSSGVRRIKARLVSSC